MFHVLRWKRWEKEPEILLKINSKLDAHAKRMSLEAEDPSYDYLVVPDTYWAQYSDLREIDSDLMDIAVQVASYYCADAVNLSFTLSSSTSGMYAHWVIEVNCNCTVYMGRKEPYGSGEHINHALRHFIADCMEKAKDYSYPVLEASL